MLARVNGLLREDEPARLHRRAGDLSDNPPDHLRDRIRLGCVFLRERAFDSVNDRRVQLKGVGGAFRRADEAVILQENYPGQPSIALAVSVNQLAHAECEHDAGINVRDPQRLFLVLAPEALEEFLCAAMTGQRVDRRRMAVDDDLA